MLDSANRRRSFSLIGSLSDIDTPFQVSQEAKDRKEVRNCQIYDPSRYQSISGWFGGF